MSEDFAPQVSAAGDPVQQQEQQQPQQGIEESGDPTATEEPVGNLDDTETNSNANDQNADGV